MLVGWQSLNKNNYANFIADIQTNDNSGNVGNNVLDLTAAFFKFNNIAEYQTFDDRP